MLTLSDLKPDHFAELIVMLAKGEVNSRVAKDLLIELFSATDGPRIIATARNLLQISDASAFESLVKDILDANPVVVTEYKSGKESVVQFFVGQAMKATRGSANPELLLSCFKAALDKSVK
jgi:aspartyl-tRNA(Asn)/glutamyl-tRNA(Gln) amidotransferase subunit B